MDQGFPDGDFPSGSPTELQRRVAAYLRAILARGWLRGEDLRAYWQGIVEEEPQRALAEQFGVSQGRPAGRSASLRDLHGAESKYAAAIPNRTPHCIESPCAVHTASVASRG